VSESTSVSVVLAQMQKTDGKMTIVVDEFGNTAGLITRQDTIAEMIGIKVPSDRTTELLARLPDGGFIVQAQMDIEDLNEQLGIDLPLADDYQTLAGFLLDRWQHIPQDGESLNHGDWNLTVISKVGPRIDRVKVERGGGGEGETGSSATLTDQGLGD
jgi:CBS domain containing-hemolysin-like protein